MKLYILEDTSLTYPENVNSRGILVRFEKVEGLINCVPISIHAYLDKEYVEKELNIMDKYGKRGKIHEIEIELENKPNE